MLLGEEAAGVVATGAGACDPAVTIGVGAAGRRACDVAVSAGALAAGVERTGLSLGRLGLAGRGTVIVCPPRGPSRALAGSLGCISLGRLISLPLGVSSRSGPSLGSPCRLSPKTRSLVHRPCCVVVGVLVCPHHETLCDEVGPEPVPSSSSGDVLELGAGNTRGLAVVLRYGDAGVVQGQVLVLQGFKDILLGQVPFPPDDDWARRLLRVEAVGPLNMVVGDVDAHEFVKDVDDDLAAVLTTLFSDSPKQQVPTSVTILKVL